ncbi:hypothetical protein TYRP_015867 [Tyrophagus putrescentiae]|nr:hypothetical protein TYRP_015867 [Tyrophagus putrescentiae]
MNSTKVSITKEAEEKLMVLSSKHTDISAIQIVLNEQQWMFEIGAEFAQSYHSWTSMCFQFTKANFHPNDWSFGQVDWSEEKQSATIGTEEHTFLPFNVVLNELGSKSVAQIRYLLVDDVPELEVNVVAVEHAREDEVIRVSERGPHQKLAILGDELVGSAAADAVVVPGLPAQIIRLLQSALLGGQKVIDDDVFLKVVLQRQWRRRRGQRQMGSPVAPLSVPASEDSSVKGCLGAHGQTQCSPALEDEAVQ